MLKNYEIRRKLNASNTINARIVRLCICIFIKTLVFYQLHFPFDHKTLNKKLKGKMTNIFCFSILANFLLAMLCTNMISSVSAGWMQAHATFYGGSDASGTMG